MDGEEGGNVTYLLGFVEAYASGTPMFMSVCARSTIRCYMSMGGGRLPPRVF